MFKVLVSDPISDFGLQQLTRAEDVEVAKITGLSEEELISIIRPYDALLVQRDYDSVKDDNRGEMGDRVSSARRRGMSCPNRSLSG